MLFVTGDFLGIWVLTVEALILSFSFSDEDTYMYYAVQLSYRRKEEPGGEIELELELREARDRWRGLVAE